MFVTRKRFYREIHDFEKRIQNLQGQITCLQGTHDWAIGQDSWHALWVRCSRCYATHPDTQKKENA
jgi:hypothetical protein